MEFCPPTTFLTADDLLLQSVPLPLPCGDIPVGAEYQALGGHVDHKDRHNGMNLPLNPPGG